MVSPPPRPSDGSSLAVRLPSLVAEIAATRRPASARGLGVCEGLGRRFGIDPLLVRVAAVLAMVSAGIGIALYGFCALWMPREDETESIVERHLPHARDWAWQRVTLGIGIACILSMSVFGSLSPTGPMPLVVLAIVVWWGSRRRRRMRAVRAASDATPLSDFDAASQAWVARLGEVYLGHEQLAAAPPRPVRTPTPAQRPPVGASRAPVPTGRRRASTAFGLAALGAATVAGIAAGLLAPGVRPALLLPASVALAVLSACLVVGAFSRRPRFAVTGALVASLLLVHSLVGPFLTPQGPAGTTRFDAAQPPPSAMTIRMRSSELDLSAVQVPPGTERVLTLTVRAADVRVVMPPSYEVRYALRAATLRLPDSPTVDGVTDGTLKRRVPGAGTLVLVLRAEAAEVDVR